MGIDEGLAAEQATSELTTLNLIATSEAVGALSMVEDADNQTSGWRRGAAVAALSTTLLAGACGPAVEAGTPQLAPQAPAAPVEVIPTDSPYIPSHIDVFCQGGGLKQVTARNFDLTVQGFKTNLMHPEEHGDFSQNGIFTYVMILDPINKDVNGYPTKISFTVVPGVHNMTTPIDSDTYQVEVGLLNYSGYTTPGSPKPVPSLEELKDTYSNMSYPNWQNAHQQNKVKGCQTFDIKDLAPYFM